MLLPILRCRRMDAGTSRKGVAASWRQWPGHDLSRVRSRKRFSAISYRRRTEDASSEFSEYRDSYERGGEREAARARTCSVHRAANRGNARASW